MYRKSFSSTWVSSRLTDVIDSVLRLWHWLNGFSLKWIKMNGTCELAVKSKLQAGILRGEKLPLLKHNGRAFSHPRLFHCIMNVPWFWCACVFMSVCVRNCIRAHAAQSNPIQAATLKSTTHPDAVKWTFIQKAARQSTIKFKTSLLCHLLSVKQIAHCLGFCFPRQAQQRLIHYHVQIRQLWTTNSVPLDHNHYKKTVWIEGLFFPPACSQ